MTLPARIQLHRTKGWRMPENTVSVPRPSVFGNPFRWQDLIEVRGPMTPGQARSRVIDSYRAWLAGDDSDWQGAASRRARAAILRALPSLRGKNLACYCPEGCQCHADVLLELANVQEPPAE